MRIGVSPLFFFIPLIPYLCMKKVKIGDYITDYDITFALKPVTLIAMVTWIDHACRRVECTGYVFWKTREGLHIEDIPELNLSQYKIQRSTSNEIFRFTYEFTRRI